MGEATPAHWFKSREEKKLHLDEVAFYNNMKTVIREIKNDGAAVFLLSYQGNPFDKKDQQMFRRLYDFEEQVLAVAAQETHVPFAPFPLSQMPESLWVDASHINAEGERIKARHAFEQFGEGLRQALGRQLEHRDDMVLEMITYD